MITKIDLSNKATFVGSDLAIMEPKKINFCFGANGSGKSVIARFIDNFNQHSQNVDWSNSPLKTLVFSREFVEKHSPANDQIPGIYTMGEGAKTARDQIDLWNDSKKSKRIKFDELENSLNKRSKDFIAIRDKFVRRCWEVENELDADFGEAISPFRKSKKLLLNNVKMHTKQSIYQLIIVK